ncbi:G-type lectin S-receptor-like serine/threonine-protein kinase At1g61550 isoform X2 [Camellia sinensis]|uniref:G-type lectin S-receptor-like serine/threonine-protein kinase At1g61550 isoform X2 n=1 Tax=Camellia sinensis TaxID=4442 RepID=UPI001036C63E|nr:G-type lectin S-receptor-like serine/threonine-protein kinase At1g61550 isoform X2 [Camellia sinensis]
MGIQYRIPFSFLSFPFLLFVLFTIPSQHCTPTDTLTQSQPISAGQTLISSGQIFELGFFIPSNSSKQYVGIWHKNIPIHDRKVVWVANRENPLTVTATDSAFSSLTIGKDGNLRLLDGMNNTLWLTNVSVHSNNSIAVLSDKGDLTLVDRVSGLTLWESFNYPCDTFLPGMTLAINTKLTGEKRFISWLTEDDPSPGKFFCRLSLDTPPQVFIWSGSKPYWRSGPWDGSKFIGILDGLYGYGDGFDITHDNQQGNVTWHVYSTSSVHFLFLTPNGSLKIMYMDEKVKNPYVTWMTPLNRCDIYGVCGPFGVCNKNKSPNCECLKGFVPNSIEDWKKGNWAGGCVRKTDLLCQKNTSSLASSGKAQNDGFWKLRSMKLPDHFEYLYSEDSSGCQQWCLSNCSCVAYAYVTGIDCLVWTGGLMDVQQFSLSGNDLYLRLSYSELGKDEKNDEKFIISFTTISGVVLLGAFMYGLHRWRANQRVNKENRRKGFEVADSMDTSELPIIGFDKILAATDNFSTTNKLGEGGFGPVYMGKLEDGQQVAVKRLSSHSGQGVEEFKNEIILISKLQHRNLVRLSGCCIEGEEKLLVYEYMTNKSLDTFLFDATKRVQLNWAKRFRIIQGIARGILYLHRDSCLRIIHRDLKASNILLDDDMNPKISDFGLARTFQVTQELANTHKVVGTFGYMSPEYVMGGLFSEKSDVYSFGVLLLEMVSGMRNTCFHYHEKYLNLLGYAWKLCRESRASDLVDEVVIDSCSWSEVMRCIHIGLLCVQDHAADRPAMSSVVLMISNEIDLPHPKQPKFTIQSLSDVDLRSQYNKICSDNKASRSIIEGR